jgi:hypothetical protein
MWFHLSEASRIVKFLETKGRKALPRVESYRVSIWEDENVLEMGGGDGCTTM